MPSKRAAVCSYWRAWAGERELPEIDLRDHGDTAGATVLVRKRTLRSPEEAAVRSAYADCKEQPFCWSEATATRKCDGRSAKGPGDMMEYLRVQLKVCEGCGNLWYRTASVDGVYGLCCAGKLALHAKAKPEQRHVSRRREHGGVLALAGAQ